MSAPTVVLVDSDFGDCELERDTVTAAGLTFIDARNLDAAERRSVLSTASGLLVQYEQIDRETIASIPHLRVIVAYGVGTDMIDTDAARAADIEVRPVLDYCVDEVADHTMALALACLRRIPQLAASVAEGRWPRTHQLPSLGALRSRRFSVVGYGTIGRAVARRALGFGAYVLAHDPAVPDNTFRDEGVEPVTLREAFRAEVVSLHLPLNPGTRKLIDAALLRTLPDGAVLVNVSRGGVIDEAALHAELRSGRILAGLDVLTEEPPTTRELTQLPNVTVTPHVAWYSPAAINRLRQFASALVVEPLVERPVVPTS